MDHVTLEVEDRIAIVTLTRPPVNALLLQTFDELKQVFDTLNSSHSRQYRRWRSADLSRRCERRRSSLPRYRCEEASGERDSRTSCGPT